MALVDQLSEDDDERVADWDRIGRAFRQPFDPEDVDFRVQGKASEQTGKAQVVAYVDARAVQDRLDDVVGPGNWSFDWEATVVDKGDVQVAKGTLTVFGVSKSDAGSASNFEQSLGAVSHCFKRAAVQWGIGRYLYGLPMAWVAVERGGRIPAPVLRDLRAQLPRPDGAKGARPEPTKRSVAIVREDATEVNTATGEVTRPAPVTPQAQGSVLGDFASEHRQTPPQATEKQLQSIGKLCEALGKPMPTVGSYDEARRLLSTLSGEFQRARRAS